MAVVLCPFFVQFLDNNGAPLNGGKVYTYAAGTSTPKATFTDFTEATPAANPVVLDSSGRTTMWISGAYKFVLTDSLGNVIRTTDNVSAFSVPAASANAYFQEFSGNGVLTAFTLSNDLGTDEKAVLVFVNNGGWIPNNPTQFTLTSGGSPAITFTVAPPNAASNIRIYAPSLYLGAASASAAAAATSEANAAASAVLASQWASQTSGIVAVTDFSAKAWAIGGTGVTNTAAAGAAKEWSITTGATVDTSDYSAKEHAIGTTGTLGSSKSWATKTSGIVASSEYSSKAYAIGGTGITGVIGSSKEWATSASKPDGVLESSKTYAALAQGYASALTDVSTTSLLIATGAKVFTVSASKAFAAGQFISAVSAANNANYMHGTVTSYTGTTLTVNVTDIGGAGTLADWQISVSGSQGATGAPGTVPDGDKGDIVVSGTGAVWTIDAAVVTEAKQVLADNTTQNVTSAKHGYAPKSPSDATQFLNGAATPAYAAVKDSDLSTSDVTTNDSSTSKHGFLKKLDNTATNFMNGQGSWANPATTAVLTGYVSGAGTVASTDTILQAIQKLNGNIAALAAAGITQIGTSTPSGVATVDFTGIPATYRGLLLDMNGISNATTTRIPLVSLNCGGGLAVDTHLYKQCSATTWSTNQGTASIFDAMANMVNTEAVSGSLQIMGYQATGFKQFQGSLYNSTSGVSSWVGGHTMATGAVQGIRVWWNLSGNFDAGTIKLSGMN